RPAAGVRQRFQQQQKQPQQRRTGWSSKPREGGWNRWFLGAPSPEWPAPPSSRGVVMTPVSASNGQTRLCSRHSCLGRYGDAEELRWYTVEFSRPYQLLELQYEQAVATYDPNAIARFASFHPWHVRSQLQMSYLLEAQGDFAEALEFV